MSLQSISFTTVRYCHFRTLYFARVVRYDLLTLQQGKAVGSSSRQAAWARQRQWPPIHK